MKESKYRKCSNRQCQCEGTHEIKRGKRNSSWYCKQHFMDYYKNKALKQKAYQDKVNSLPPSPTCQNHIDGKVCGKSKAVAYKPHGTIRYFCPECLSLKKTKKKQRDRASSKRFYQKNRKAILQKSKMWRQKNKTKRKLYFQAFYQNNKNEINFNRELNRASQWYLNYQIIKQIKPDFIFSTFCDQESRRLFLLDFASVGLFIENEYSFISGEGLRKRTNIDLRTVIGDKIYYIETKSTEATFSKNKTKAQVAEYIKLHGQEIQNGFRDQENAVFISWSPSGDNSDVCLMEMYQLIYDEITKIYRKIKRRHPRRFKAEFRKVFPFLNYEALGRLIKTRVKQLQRAEQYMVQSPSFDFNTIKHEVVDLILSGQLYVPNIDLKKLKEKYGN